MPDRIPEELLEALLGNYFPMISGPDQLESVVPLLEARGGEFCGSLRLDAEMVAATCAAGFLPMSESFTGREVLLIKAHTRRCVHRLESFPVSRSELRKSRGTTLRFDTQFRTTLKNTVAAHRERWLTEPLCHALAELHHAPRRGVRAHSVELCRDDRMIAGEIGYSVGGIYTSLSGFYHESGAGKVQLLALGIALRASQFRIWDLGMPMHYKHELGAADLPRTEFMRLCMNATPHQPDLSNSALHKEHHTKPAGEVPTTSMEAHQLLRRARAQLHPSRSGE